MMFCMPIKKGLLLRNKPKYVLKYNWCLPGESGCFSFPGQHNFSFSRNFVSLYKPHSTPHMIQFYPFNAFIAIVGKPDPTAVSV